MNPRRSRAARAIALLLAAAVVTIGVDLERSDRPVAEAAPIGTGDPSKFEPVGPVRLADTRRTDCSCTVVGDRTTRVQVAGRAGIPSQITAAAVTVTVTRTAHDGYATVYPGGTSRPVASTVNYVAHGATANSTIVRVGPDGTIDVSTSTNARVIVDVTGIFTAATDSSTGRYVALPARRILDGRHPGATVGEMSAGSSATIPMPATVPDDATAVAVNVTNVGARRAGFLTGHAAGTSEPGTSFLNVSGDGRPVAASVILPVSADGVTIANSAGGRLLIDLAGYFTGPSAAVSSDGLFVPTTPTRLLDTRPGPTRLWADGTIEVASPFADASALVTNVTMVRSDGLGFTTAHSAGVARPIVSAVNATRRDQTIPNAAITSTSTRGVAYHASISTDLLVDLNGYFVGEPVPATLPVPPNTAVPRRVLLVGDSTLAVIRNMPQTHSLFVGFDAIVDAEGCRRLVWPSCWSDSDFRVPNTIQEAILETPGVLDVVVVMSGYNDWDDPFGMFVDTIMQAARAKGARQVVWLTLSVGVPPESSPAAIAAYAQNTRDLWASAPRHPDLVVADWRTYNSRSVGWMSPDGVHLDPRGGYGLADYLSRWIAHLDERPCHAPVVVGGPVQNPCPSPNDAFRVTDIPSIYGI